MALTQISTQGIKDGTITGTDLATNVDLIDNQKLRLGTGNDYEIYFDGSNAVHRVVGDGDLKLLVEEKNFIVQGTGGHQILKGIDNGAVELYHDNSKKFETTSAGGTLAGNLTVNGNVFCTNVEPTNNIGPLADNKKILIGNSADLEIFHNGTHSRIVDAGTGNLQIAGSLVQITNAAVTESGLVFHEDGALELYHDGSKKFETTSTGATVTGNLFVTNKFRGNDNVKLELGTGNDLQIYHDGANSIIDNNTGDLILRSDADDVKILAEDGIVLRDNDDSTNFINCINGGAVELYHNGSKKAETYSAGLFVTGTLTVDTGNIVGLDNAKLKLGTSDDFQFFHDGSTNVISGQFHPIEIRHQSEVHIKCVDDGAVELYHDNSKKFETDSDGGKLTGYLHAHARVSESGFTNLDRHVIQTFVSNKECLVVESTASTPFGMRINYKNASPDNNSSYFLQCRDQSVDRLFIWSDGDIDNHDNSYGGMSDEKLKENIVDANSQWEDVKAIKVRNFNFKTDTPSDRRLGVVAQELETICPSLVREKSDFDENNNDLGTKTKSVKYSILYMKAFKALQEAITKIEVLEAKVAALEAG